MPSDLQKPCQRASQVEAIVIPMFLFPAILSSHKQHDHVPFIFFCIQQFFLGLHSVLLNDGFRSFLSEWQLPLLHISVITDRL